ncbi:MAG TPA: hypothetical protein VFF48_11445 [Brevundimonas sp.]|nr:hypothetical protein [Brevundimonas sp.]
MKLLALVVSLAVTVGTPALARQEPARGPDEPMRELFKSPGIVAYITAPRPGQEGRTSAWTWIFLKQPIPAGADALAMEWDIDCTARTVRAVNTVLYHGDAYMQTDAGQAPRAAPAPGTPAALALGAACAPPGRSRIAMLPNRAAARSAAATLFAAQP